MVLVGLAAWALQGGVFGESSARTPEAGGAVNGGSLQLPPDGVSPGSTFRGPFSHSPLGRSILTTPHRPLPSLQLTSPFTPPTTVSYTKRQLSNLVGCGYRDLRCLDEKYDKRGKGSVVLPRRGGLIVKICLSRAIILKHKEGEKLSCYIFPGTPHSDDLVNFLEHGSGLDEGSVMNPDKLGHGPKELGGDRMFECLIGMGLEEVAHRFESVKAEIETILGELGEMRTSGVKSAKFGFLSTQSKVTALLPLKNRLDSMEGILTDIYQTFLELLQVRALPKDS